MAIEDALNSLREGNFVLIHDSDSRENETDFVIAAEFIRAEHIARMRTDGAGLICVAIGKELSEQINLPFLVDVERLSAKKFKLLEFTNPDDIPYDEKSSFSISVNHRKTFTGITDEDRALTIRKLVEFFKDVNSEDPAKKFGKEFRSPGHVFLLRSSGLDSREGHTELSTALLEMAGLTPVAAICEMMDSSTHKALPREKALEYANKNGIPLLDALEVKKSYENRNL